MRLTVAVLGAGGWGWNWTERALRDPDCKVVALADTNPAVLKSLEDRGLSRSLLFSDAAEALAAGHTDLVTCSIPNPRREPHLRAALADGRHVLVDKPLAHTIEATRDLLTLARDRRTAFIVAQNYRRFEGVQRIVRALGRDGIGPVFAIHAHFLRSAEHMRHSIVRFLPGFQAMGLEMCIHHFDLMRLFLGGAPVSVSAHAWRSPVSSGEGYDGLDVHLEFPNGVHVAYDATWAASHDGTDWCGHWEILAERGGISYGGAGRSLRVFGPEGRTLEHEPEVDVNADTKQSLDSVWATFKQQADAISVGVLAPGDEFCSLEDNALTMAIALAAERSVDTGAPVEFEGFRRRSGLI